jgi:8-oxo-dGTP pyrophosphatase MutT (NUDIX family)
MSASKFPTKQYRNKDFVVSAGSTLFRYSTTGDLEICIIYDTTRDQWFLPKGRKDKGESIEAAAVRETFEETGYECELWPQRMWTRAPDPGVNDVDGKAEEVDGLAEPIMVTVREYDEGRGPQGLEAKFIWWYITLAQGEKILGTQGEHERHESRFMGVGEAVELLKFQVDKDVVEWAQKIVMGRM